MRPLLVGGRIGVKLMLGCTAARIGAAVEGGCAWMGLKAYMVSYLPPSSLAQFEERASLNERMDVTSGEDEKMTRASWCH